MFQGTYVEAVRQALFDAMEADSRVCCLGEDIGVYGGAFRATEGLLERFGPDRVIDTPIAEQAIAGAAIGAALMGQRPVAEFQFMDFALLASDLMVNFAAKAHWRWGASVPAVFRGPAGGGNGGGPFHSQNPEGHFLGSPGLKVVAPGTVRDAYALLRAAIEDPDPVLVFEHKHLYRRLKDQWSEAPTARLGEAALRRDGASACIITYGASQHVALEAVGGSRRRGAGSAHPLAPRRWGHHGPGEAHPSGAGAHGSPPHLRPRRGTGRPHRRELFPMARRAGPTGRRGGYPHTRQPPPGGRLPAGRQPGAI